MLRFRTHLKNGSSTIAGNSVLQRVFEMRSSHPPWDLRRHRGPARSLVLIGVLIGIAAYSCSFYEYVRGYSLQPGAEPLLSSPTGRRALRDITLAAPGRLLDAFRMEPIERLSLEIEPRHFQTITDKRQQALRRSFLITSKDDFVPATLVHRGNKLRVRVRLKGDLTDHLLGHKWSYRVEVRDGGSVLGMQRFSVQAPYTRNFQSEPLFLDFLRERDILAPRYFFVDLTVNGRPAGRMALEEHFSTEILERQSRRDGVIVRLDEQYLYRAELAFMTMVPDYDNWRNAPLDAFRLERIQRSPELRPQMQVAFGLLRGVAEDRLPPAQVFDVALWGRFLAACEIWSMPHMTHWNNLRFYLNPFTLRLEPIGFDANGETQTHPGFHCMGGAHAMMTRLVEDAEMRAAFLDSLQRLSKQVADPGFETWLRQREARYLPLLAREFPWLRPYPLEMLRRRAQEMGRVSEANFARHLAPPPDRVMPHSAGADYPTVVYAHLQSDASGPFLALASAISLPVTVTELWIETPGDPSSERGPARDAWAVFHPLPATPWPHKPRRVRVELPQLPPSPLPWNLGGRALVRGKSYTFRTTETAPPLERPPLPQVTLEHTLERHPYLHRDSDPTWLVVEPGSFDVHRSIVLPEGLGLRIGPGTTLRFGRNQMLLARGPLEFLGSATAPIVLEALEQSWHGIVALGADSPSHWSHVVVRNTTAPEIPGWGVTGGVTFRGTDLTLEDCSFQGSRAEDALNLVRSRITLHNLAIRDVDSDALDADFCHGHIQGGHIAETGGDGIDVSGSQLEITDVSFRHIRDKAISVGEGSQVAIRGVRVTDSAIGVASKDRSRTRIESSSFSGIERAALMAYIKKPQYGPAEIEAAGVHIEGARREAVAQLGSRISLNGRAIEPEPLNVDALYDSGPLRE
jgi:hypothetical protein